MNPKIARALTQGSLADSATLGWRTQSLWDCRTIGLSVVPYGTDLALNFRKALVLAVASHQSQVARNQWQMARGQQSVVSEGKDNKDTNI